MQKVLNIILVGLAIGVVAVISKFKPVMGWFAVIFVCVLLVRIIFLKRVVKKGELVSAKIIKLKKLKNEKENASFATKAMLVLSLPAFLAGLYVALSIINLAIWIIYGIMTICAVGLVVLFKISLFGDAGRNKESNSFYDITLEYNDKLYRNSMVSGIYLKNKKINDNIFVLISDNKLFFLKNGKPALIYAGLKV